MMSRHFVATSLVLSSLVVLAPAHAAGPNAITPVEAVAPTCFGMSATHMYAVRKKVTCEPTTSVCEVATYLAEVDARGYATTVGYLAYYKGEGMPPDGKLPDTVKPASLDKAHEAMKSATMSCRGAAPGQTLELLGGKRKVTLVAGAKGWYLNSDNLRQIGPLADLDALLWSDEGRRWYTRRTLTRPDGTGSDVEFAPLAADDLFADPPSAASAVADAITVGNIGVPGCRGWELDVSRAWVLDVTAENGSASAELVSLLALASRVNTYGTKVAERPLPPFVTDPKVALASVTPAELGLSNGRMAAVDARCSAIPIAPFSPVTLKVRGQDVTVSWEAGVGLRFVGPQGGRKIVRTPFVPTTLLMGDDPRATTIIIRPRGGEEGSAVAIDPLLATPALFPLPDALTAPLCFRAEAGLQHFISVERAIGAPHDKISLVVRAAGSKGAAESTLATLEIPTGAALDPARLLAAVTRDMRIDLADKYPNATACPVTPIAGGGTYRYADTDHTVLVDGANVQVKRGEKTLPIADVGKLGTPRWLIETAGPPFIAVAKDALGLEVSYVPAPTTKAFERAPDPPEIAMKSPKLLDGDVPGGSDQKRCLGWQSADRVAWIAREQGYCEDAGGEHCAATVILTEVKKDGYYQRVTLSKNGEAWTHMFKHANSFIGRADVGCIDDDAIKIRGVDVSVVQDGAKLKVAANDKSITVGTLTNTGEDVTATTETLRTVYWHPDVTALVIEIDTREEHGEDQRYIWVDLARVGIK